MTDPIPQRREMDHGWLGIFTKFWNFIDERDIDKHVISVAIMWGTWRITEWAFHFAYDADRPGLEVAAIIAAVTTPYTALQAAAVAFYFKSRTA